MESGLDGQRLGCFPFAGGRFGRNPSPPTFSQLQPGPAEERLADRPGAPGTERVAPEEKAVTGVVSTPDAALAAGARHCREARVVGAHQVEERNRREGRKDRFTQPGQAALVRL